MTFTAKVVTAVVSSLGVGGTGVTSYIYLNPLATSKEAQGESKDQSRAQQDTTTDSFSVALSGANTVSLDCSNEPLGDKRYHNISLTKKTSDSAELQCSAGDSPQVTESLKILKEKPERSDEEELEVDSDLIGQLSCSTFDASPPAKNFTCTFSDSSKKVTMTLEDKKVLFKVGEKSSE